MKKLLIILSVCLIGACNDIENCNANDDLSYMIVRFFDKETAANKKVGFLIGSGTFAYGEGFWAEDSTAIALPLNPNTEQTTFFFISDTSNHELVMSYDVEASIFDPDCSPSFTFLNLDTLSQTFDSTVVVGTVTNRQLSTNVEIYF